MGSQAFYLGFEFCNKYLLNMLQIGVKMPLETKIHFMLMLVGLIF